MMRPNQNKKIKSLRGDSASASDAFSSWQEQHWILILNLAVFAPAVHPQPSCRNISVGLENLKQMCAAQQTDVKNNTSSRERACFLCCWMNKQPASAGRGSYCMYSHTSAFDHLSSPLWLTYLLSFPLNTKKIRIEDEAGRRGRLLGLLRCTPLLPEVSNSTPSTCFWLFSLLFQVGSVGFHAALLRFSSRFHFIVRS